MNSFDATEITLKILSCIYRSQERYGTYLIASVLCGKRNKKVEEFGLDKLSTFGIVTDFTSAQVKAIIHELLRCGLIFRSTEHKNLKISDTGKKFLKQKYKLEFPISILENAKSELFSHKLLLSHLSTLMYWQKGMDVSRIAKYKKLKESTIEDHLSNLVFHGKITDISRFVPKEKEYLIKNVLLGFIDNQQRLKVIKDKLPPEITYGQIKIVIAKYSKIIT